jgi:hypothetical protein
MSRRTIYDVTPLHLIIISDPGFEAQPRAGFYPWRDGWSARECALNIDVDAACALRKVYKTGLIVVARSSGVSTFTKIGESHLSIFSLFSSVPTQ